MVVMAIRDMVLYAILGVTPLNVEGKRKSRSVDSARRGMGVCVCFFYGHMKRKNHAISGVLSFACRMILRSRVNKKSRSIDKNGSGGYLSIVLGWKLTLP